MKYSITFTRLSLDGINLGSKTVTRTWKNLAAINSGIGLLKSQHKGEVLRDIKYRPLISVLSLEKVEEIPVYDGRPIINDLKYMGNHLQCPTCGVVVSKDGCMSC